MNAPVIWNRCARATRLLTIAVLEIMTGTLYSRLLIFPLVLIFLIVVPAFLWGQTGSMGATVAQLNHLTSSSALPNGIEVRDGEARMQIVALRQHVVRVRLSRTQDLPEDASWAVLKEAKQSSVAVTPDDTPSAVGFRTQALRVSINRQTFALTIADRDGNILQEDVRPVEFHGGSFQGYKTMPLDEH